MSRGFLADPPLEAETGSTPVDDELDWVASQPTFTSRQRRSDATSGPDEQ